MKLLISALKIFRKNILRKKISITIRPGLFGITSNKYSQNKPKTFLRILIILFICTHLLEAQYLQAPEVWSKPIKISRFNLSKYYADMPSITPDGSKIFFITANPPNPTSIYCSEKTDTGWNEPRILTSYINQNLAEAPSISPDGKKLYFRRYDNGGYGDWDLWVSEWSDRLNDWGPSKNLGPNINSSAIEWFGYTPDNKYFYFERVSGLLTDIRVSEWNDTTQQWGTSSLFDNHQLNVGHDIDGMTMTQNKKKLYFSMYTFNNYPKHDEFDIYVSYFDSTKGFYGTPMLLNVNSHPDSSVPEYNPGNLGYDGYPTITADGRYLYFSSNRDDTNHVHGGNPIFDIYESKLLVDENGDTVTNIKEENKYRINSFELFQNYPNPFNPSTTISFDLIKQLKVKIIIYDNLGRKIRELADSFFTAGIHEVIWDGKDEFGNKLPSGVYYYSLFADKYRAVKKMIILK